MNTAATRAAIKRASQQARNAMQQLDGQSVDALMEIYSDAMLEVKTAIRARVDANDMVPQAALKDLLRQIEDIIDALGQHRDALLEQKLTEAADLGVRPYTLPGVAATGRAGQAVLTSAAAMTVSQEAVAFVQSFTAADGLKLSDRVWRLDQGAKEALTRAVGRAVVAGWDASKASAQFMYSGQAVPGDVRARLAGAKAGELVRQADLLTGDGGEVWKADRVFRTEINRAHGTAYMAGAEKTPGFVGFRFLLSPRHPRPDVCDHFANQNLYGLGKGVYPSAKACPWPAHPNTLSFVEMVFDTEVTAADKAGKETPMQALARLPADVRDGVLGKTKATYFDQGLLGQGSIRSKLKVVDARLERQGILPEMTLKKIETAPIAAIHKFVTEGMTGKVDQRLLIGPIGGETARFVREKLERDPANLTRTLEASAVRHTLKQHGNAATEAARGQVAITAADFERVQKIATGGRRELSDRTSRGSPVVKIQLSLGGYDYTVLEVVRRDDVTLGTMWKKKTKGP
ncbi:MAG: hypothetical protein IPN53_05205 [Comamonadaceae bacterium]|nr:hypothetical protein [Comamonadaceae bacterium]